MLTNVGFGDYRILAFLNIDAEGVTHVRDGFAALVEQLLLLVLVKCLFILLFVLGLVAALEVLVKFFPRFLQHALDRLITVAAYCLVFGFTDSLLGA